MKKTASGSAAPAMPKAMKPSMRFDLHPDSHVPAVGDMVHAKMRGKVMRIEQGKDRYPDPGKKRKNRTTVEIEHEDDSAMMEPAGKKRSIAEIEEANERV